MLLNKEEGFEDLKFVRRGQEGVGVDFLSNMT